MMNKLVKKIGDSHLFKLVTATYLNRWLSPISILTLLITVIAMSPSFSSDEKIKTPNVSGQFYSSNPERLSLEIEKYLKQADVEPIDKHVDVIIVPHAGYMYSGPVAAYGFKAASKNKYKTIVILAASHFVGFDGVSVWNEGAFKTPLGTVDVDEKFAKKLIDTNNKFYFEPKAFEQEHSLEVEIPFAQTVFDDFKIVPVIFGQPNFQTVKDFALSLHKIIGDRDDVLIVVSTDMSHYHDGKFAKNMDRRTLQAIEQFKTESLWKECRLRTMELCGYVPVTVALLYAQEKGLNKIDVLQYADSGDVTGDKSAVVGYASIAIYKNNDSGAKSPDAQKDKNEDIALTQDQKRNLLGIARKTIEQFVRTGKKNQVKETDPRLMQEEGAFVTINRQGRLRGCIGNILGRGPLYLTVRDMAIASCSQDPRFPPVQEKELKDLHVEISVLSKPKLIKNVDEIQLGVHGVIVGRGPFNQGVFLPQVATSTGWSKEEFLSQLCSQKAHLAADCWKDPKTRIEIFTADVFSE